LHATFDETAFVAALSDCWPPANEQRVMIDVGAHVGGSLAPFLKRGWKILAYEPDPANRQKLVAFVRGNGNVVISDRAVSDVADEEVTLYSSRVSTGISTLSPFHESHQPKTVVRTTTLRDAVAESGIGRVDFLKIDVEGLEMKVLSGFPWETLRPAVIECEFEDSKTTRLGYDTASMVEYLAGKGYHVYVSEWHPVLRYGVRHDWSHIRKYAPGCVDAGAWGNLLAFREPPDESVMREAAQSLVSLRTLNPVYLLRRPRELRALARRGVGAMRRRPHLSEAFALAVGAAGLLWLAPGTNASTILVGTAVLAAGIVAKRQIDKQILAVKNELAAERGRLVRDLRDCEKRVDVLEKTVTKLGYANATRFQPFPREIKDRDVTQFHDVWAKRLDLPVSRSAIGYMSFRIAMVESLCVGRLATAIETAVLRTLVAYAVRGSSLHVLEIGTLFGVSVGAIYDVCRGRHDEVRLTVIDPFDGYYGANKADIATDQAVTEPQFRRNMRRVGVEDSELHVIRAYSHDQAAVAAAATATYDVLYIDGDHSGVGVIKDFDLYHGMVRPGGFIVFDDYGTDHWPEIKPAVDQHVMSRPDLEFIGADFRTAVFRVRSVAMPPLANGDA
jgi:FkbM family methyltransferase